MIQVPESYRPFLEEGAVDPSAIAAVLPAWAPLPDFAALQDRLRGHRLVTRIDAVEDDATGAPTLTFRAGTGEGALELFLRLEPSEDLSHYHTDSLGVTRAELEAAQRSEWTLYLETAFSDQVLADFHTQLILIAHLAPDAVVLHDISACRLHSGSWLRSAAQSAVPPPPDSLYMIHVIQDEDAEPGAVWLHSHGLLRCGAVELEMLGVPADNWSPFANLFHVAAVQCIEQGNPLPGESFTVGEGLTLAWIPWEEAIELVPEDSLGGRRDRDDAHDQPSGVLIAPGGGPLSLLDLAEVLEREPPMFLSRMESQRMSLFAKQRFPRFRQLQRRFGQAGDWHFHVKLGYQVDDCPEEEDHNEHLWFEVHGLRSGQVDATLLNEPYWIARMHAGDRTLHALDQLSDWLIVSPHGQFDANTVLQLEERLAGER